MREVNPLASLCKNRFSQKPRSLDDVLADIYHPVLREQLLPHNAVFSDEELDILGRGSSCSSDINSEIHTAEDHLIFLKRLMDEEIFDPRKTEKLPPGEVREKLALVSDGVLQKYMSAKNNYWVKECSIAQETDKEAPSGPIQGTIHSDYRKVDLRETSVLERLHENFRLKFKHQQAESRRQTARTEAIILDFESTMRDCAWAPSPRTLAENVGNFIADIRSARTPLKPTLDQYWSTKIIRERIGHFWKCVFPPSVFIDELST
jgi:hypothetical protein